VHAIGPGFFGDFSRHSATVTTRSASVATAWLAAVQAGKVRVSD
jgi:hypothetical protein